MLKAAHIITRLDFGGAQGNTLYTARTLDKSRFEASIVCGHRGDLEHRVFDKHIRYAEHLVRQISPLKDIRAFFELLKILKELKPDIVHTHSSKAGILGRLAAAAAGVPVIVHTQSLINI
jgi:UDP-N-acetylglucosamine:LPS N-acetylglucosamine transferase